MAEGPSLDYERFRTRLHEARLQLELDLETHRRAVIGLSGGPDEPGSGQHWERSGYGDHQADDGTELFEREKEVGLEMTLAEKLAQVTHALHRLDAGTYGRCESCDRPIAIERLDALPEAALCIDCKAKEEQRTAPARQNDAVARSS